MQRRWLLGAALAALVPAPGRLAGQEPEARPAPGPWEVRVERGPDRLMHIVMNRRARLGLKVNLRARETDSIGAYVDAVTPGGPAARAGIHSGDIITKLNGTSVLAGGRPGEADGRHSLPGLRLIELAARLAPNDTVRLELRRGGERKVVSLVTADEPEIAFEGQPGSRRFAFRLQPGPAAPPPPGVPGDLAEAFGGPPELEFLSGSPLAELELAPLNPELGQYFGVAEGVLVIRAPKDVGLGLRGGDVILAVDGRKPTSPSHLLRILRSYEGGEPVKLDIMRNRRREAVSGQLGER